MESAIPGAIEVYRETNTKAVYDLLDCLCEDYGNIQPKKWLEPLKDPQKQTYFESDCYFFVFLRNDTVLGYFALQHAGNDEFYAHFFNFKDVPRWLWRWLLKKGLQLCHTVHTKKVIFNFDADPKLKRILEIWKAKQTGEEQWEM